MRLRYRARPAFLLVTIALPLAACAGLVGFPDVPPLADGDADTADVLTLADVLTTGDAPTKGPGSQDEDSGVGPTADADNGTPSEDAAVGVDSTVASGRDADASAPADGNPPGRPEASEASSVSTPDTGNDVSSTGGDVDACTVNLSCVLTAPPSTGDIRQDCVNRVNQFRTTCACVKPLARWTDGEACADMDAQYDAMMNMAHAGAMANICNWGSAQDECPAYSNNQSVVDTCLQQMWNEGPPPAGTTVAQCESASMLQTCYVAHGHFINMSNPNMTKIACGFYTTTTGSVWATQNLSP